MLSKVFLAVSCLLFYWASNPVLAQETTSTAVIEQGNPWYNSQYTDLRDIANLLLKNGYSIDEYFYSEGFTTGTDGKLGNEYVCIRDDSRRVYIGRSDVCVDRTYDGYDYIFLDQIDLNKVNAPLYDPDINYTTGDLIGDNSQYWSGCYTINEGWGGDRGGQCPTINDNYGGQINYGYIEQTLTNIAAIDVALKNAGLETSGYTYSWNVKNANANIFHGIQGANQDPFSVTISIVDENKNIVFEKTYDYSYTTNWITSRGTETFENPFDLDTIDSIQLSIKGYDAGYWAGRYGPEFSKPDVRLNYRVRQDIGPSPEEMLFEQQCSADPTSNPACPGYNDAMIAQITQTTTDITIDSGVDLTTGILDSTETNSANTGIPDSTGTSTDTFADTASTGGSSPVAETTSQSTGVSTIESTSVADPVAEATKEVAEATSSTPVTAAAEKESSGISSPDKPAGGPSLTATQLSAVTAAADVANSAVSTATDSAQASAGVGLSEDGSVSSELTAVDTTGTLNSDGTISSSISDIMSNDFSASGVSMSEATTDAFDASGVSMSEATTDISTDGTGMSEATTDISTDGTGMSDTAFTDSTDFTGSDDSNMSNSGSGDSSSFANNGSDNGSSNGQDNGQDNSNNGQQSDLAGVDAFGNDSNFNTGDDTDTADNLAQGSAVETQDITGEQTLAAVNNELTSAIGIKGSIIDDIINGIANTLISSAVEDANQVAEESAEESFEDQNAKEDALVQAAQSGDDSEDAQAALLGYNPNFRAYQQPQMQGGEIYNDQSVYENQKTYDSPKAGLFNGASDATHRAMVRQQYERGQ